MFLPVWRLSDFRFLVIWMLTKMNIQVLLKKKPERFLSFKSLRKNVRIIFTNVTVFAQISPLVRIHQTGPSYWGNKSTCIPRFPAFNSTNRLKKQIVCWFSYQKEWFSNLANQNEEIIFSANQLQDQNQPWCELRNAWKRFMFSRYCCGLHNFLLFASAKCFPAFGNGFLILTTCFPPFRMLFPVLYAAYMFSRHRRCLRVLVLCNGLVFFRQHNQSHNFASSLWLVYIAVCVCTQCFLVLLLWTFVFQSH